MTDVVSEIKRAKSASIELSVLSTEVKNNALRAMVDALDSSREQILEANARDLEAAKSMLDSGEISGSMYKRLKIDGSKIDGMIAASTTSSACRIPWESRCPPWTWTTDSHCTRYAVPSGCSG